jgi:ABC-2 type transport system ATP-binding protein
LAQIEAQIAVQALSKTYRVPVREEGLGAAFKSLLHREYRQIAAVQDVSFQIEPGEMVGLLGANGAGKTTILKLLAGLLYPSEGTVRVAGFVPSQRRPDYLRRVSMVLGNKSQLMSDIPPMDSFRVQAEIYRVPPAEFKRSLEELVDLLDLGELLMKPVRNLSLGERMKCELAAGLLYRPAVLFLDEPTLGLDVSMQRRLREFIGEYNRQSGATVILTSHYMADVQALCPRVIMIDHGKLLYDGSLDSLGRRLAPFKLIRLTFSQAVSVTPGDGLLPVEAEVVEQAGDTLVIRVHQEQASRVVASLLQSLPVVDLTVEDPPIEAVLDQVFTEGRV